MWSAIILLALMVPLTPSAGVATGGSSRSDERVGFADAGELTKTTDWVRLPDGPTALAGHAMVGIGSGGKLLIFGGFGGGTLMYNQTWTLSIDNGSWTDVTDSYHPSARYGHALVQERSSSGAILFGGFDGAYRRDTWRFTPSNSTWNNLSSMISPPERAAAGMVEDTATGDFYLFGGTDAARRLNDTWVFNATTGVWTNLSILQSPSPRAWAVMTAAGNGKVFLFGGSADPVGGSPLGDTWILSTKDKTWRQIQTPVRPGDRAMSGGAYFAPGDRVVVFGGRWGESWYGDTWIFDLKSESWINVPTGVGPGSRYGHATALEPGSAQVVVSAGMQYRKPTSPGAHTWVFDATAVPPPPTLVESSPNDGATGVPLNPSITLRFSQPMEPISTSRAFSVDPQVGPAPVYVNGDTLAFTPPSKLSPDTMYHLRVSTEALGSGGVPLATPIVISFTTSNDTSPPTPKVLSVLPSPDAKDVSVDAKISLTFSERMHHTATEGAISSEPAVYWMPVWNSDSTELLLVPVQDFADDTEYRLTVSTSATSESGVRMTQPWTWRFTTTGGPGGGIQPVAPPGATVDLVVLSLMIAGVTLLTVAVLWHRRRYRPEKDESGNVPAPTARPPGARKSESGNKDVEKAGTLGENENEPPAGFDEPDSVRDDLEKRERM